MKKTILIVLVFALCMVGEIAKADFIFGTPTKVPNVNTSSMELNANISADGLLLYFISNRSGGIGGLDIWVASRATKDDDWGEPANLGPAINTPVGEWGVSISHDGLSLYFDTRQSGASGAIDDLWVATRATKNDDWSNPVNLGSMVNSGADDYAPSISSDELSLYFTSGPGSGGYGNYDLWVTKRETTDEDWGAPVNLGPTINSSAYEVDPDLSADGRVLFFASDRSGGYGGDTDIWMTMRATVEDPWGEPVNLGPVINSSDEEDYPNVSPDGSTLFFRYSQSGRNSGGDIWQAPIITIIDFNGDGIVDSTDMCIMIDYWGTDEPLCDIGPMPWGDGIVDVQDLIVLAEHLFEDYRLVAHWKLDEMTGDIAYDSAGEHDGTLNGEPLWQPNDGQVAGALEFDGIDDYISAPFILNPGKESIGAFAWIKDGSPGQVIISQIGDFGDTWICIDPLGKLLTELGSMYFGVLTSETIVTDDQWHHVGLVYDMDKFHRLLYVDGVMEAEDTTFVAGTISDGGLYIGASKDFEADSFFSGLIDDVRIYNKALSVEEIAVLAQ